MSSLRRKFVLLVDFTIVAFIMKRFFDAFVNVDEIPTITFEGNVSRSDCRSGKRKAH